MIARHREQRIARHAVQERRVEAARQELALADQHEVGGARLLHLPARAEQHLIDLIFRARAQGGTQGRGVIAARLDHAHLRGRARVLIIDQNAQRLHAAGKVIPHRACQHHQQGVRRGGRRRADIRGGAEQNGPQIQRARRLRHRVAAALDHGAHHVGELLRIRFGQHQLPRALAHALDVPIHAEDVDGAVGAAKCLEPLEAGARVMQHMRRGAEFDRRRPV